MRVLFVGDVVARPGLRAVAMHLPDVRDRYDWVIVNGENAAGGKGLDKKSYRILREAGADLITLGNHAWDKKDVYDLIEREPIVRAANYPPGTPGRGWWVLERGGFRLLVVQVMGRVFMDALDDPFRTVDRVLEEVPHDAAIVEIHAEATSEKYALGFYLDGRVAAVLGTHTHVPTLDAGFLPGGTAFQTDVGMTGTYRSIIGGEVKTFLDRFLTARPQPFRSAEGPALFVATELVFDGPRVQAISPYRWEEP
ncbi:TIGR00282 family metallophosphoesterase [Oceanithermus sp.]|uniref:TIGR00282 family metallophosphoesterase n=1 Tax=Oceanithermus sp. TaxID=2268145 RepID=UPI00257F64D9|nr:TIGR00282 family metallophosphoesterase [Oceanithermus sp.]